MLSQIAAKKKERVEAARTRLPLKELKRQIPDAGPLRPFRKALNMPGMSVIAEVKKASPSKGDFQLTIPVDELASRYQAGCARAISVLTEEDFFKGSISDLLQVRQSVALPVLRKDFVLDEYQLYESRLHCADAVLLIAGFLGRHQIQEYLEISAELGLAVLVEAHNEAEVEMALRSGAAILGINNRDLKTFQTDVNHTVKLAQLVPDDVILVSESGIRSAEDVKMLAEAGADAILVGETLVCSADPAQMLKKLTGGCANDEN